MALIDEAQKKVAATNTTPTTTAAATTTGTKPPVAPAPAPAVTPSAPPAVPKAYTDVANGATTKATTGTFDESKGVAGRVASIARSGSPLMDLARTQAAQDANSMGLRRSSMAVGAAQDAVLRQAIPIASADAQGYQTQQLANQDAQNTVAIKNADRIADIKLKGLEADNRIKLTEMEAAYRTQIGANENVANAWGTMLTEISKIQNNPDIGPTAKKTYIQNLLNGFQGYAKFWGDTADIDVDGLLDFSITTPAPKPAPTAPGAAPGVQAPSDQGGGA